MHHCSVQLLLNVKMLIAHSVSSDRGDRNNHIFGISSPDLFIYYTFMKL